MKLFLVLLLSLSFLAHSQDIVFKIGDVEIVVQNNSKGSYDLTSNGREILHPASSVMPVSYDPETQSFKGMFFASADDHSLYYFHVKKSGEAIVENTGIMVDKYSPNYDQITLQDGDFKQEVTKVTYGEYKEKNGRIGYDKAIIYYLDEKNEFINHHYYTQQKNDKIKPVHKLDGERVRLFKTGDNYMDNPVVAVPNARKSNLQGFTRPNPEVIKLPDAPERIRKEFEILTLDDISDEELIKAKELVGTNDFYKIMEAFVEGSGAILGESGEGAGMLLEKFYTAALAGYIPGLDIQEVLILTRDSFESNTKHVGEASDKLAAVKKYYKQGNDRRLIIAEDIHTLRGAGAGGADQIDHIQVLKRDMLKGKFKMIGTTTLSEFNAFVGGDSALESKFTKIFMDKKTHQDIIDEVKYNAKTRNIEIPDHLIERIILYSDQYDVVGAQPAKAVKLANKSIAKLKTRYPGEKVLIEEAVTLSVADLYHSDIKMLDPQYAFERVSQLKKVLDEKVIGLEQAKESLIESSKQRVLGMKDADKPPLRGMFIGPPGTGKSYLAKVYAEAMGFKAVIISMNTYGTPYDKEEFLNEVASNLRNYPEAVLIFDEFEKGSHEVQLACLQMLNDGKFKQLEKMKNSKQTRPIPISSKRAGFILTSNLGDKEIKKLFTSLLQIELEKTQDVEKAQAEASRVFNQYATKAKLEAMLEEKGFNTAIMDRMDFIHAIAPPNKTEFRQNIELYFKLFLSDYEKRNGLKLSIRNLKKSIDAVMTHYKPGHSNRDAQKMIEQVLNPQITKKLTPDSLKKEKLSLTLPLKDMKFTDLSPTTTLNLKKLITMHELHGHWLVNYMLYGENRSNHVTVIPGDGYLGFVSEKVNHNLVTETLETFTGMFKEVLILEAGYRAEKIISGVSGRGAGSINRKTGAKPTDDLGKINKMYDRWINNNFFKNIIENHPESVKTKFKLEMAEIIREATDFIIKKGLANKVGNEAVDKLLKDGKLHGEYLDEYSSKLNKKLKFTPEQTLDEALNYAKSKLVKTRQGIGFVQSTIETKSSVGNLIDQIIEKINDEKLFFNASCDQYFTAKN